MLFLMPPVDQRERELAAARIDALLSAQNQRIATVLSETRTQRIPEGHNISHVILLREHMLLTISHLAQRDTI